MVKLVSLYTCAKFLRTHEIKVYILDAHMFNLCEFTTHLKMGWESVDSLELSGPSPHFGHGRPNDTHEV